MRIRRREYEYNVRSHGAEYCFERGTCMPLAPSISKPTLSQTNQSHVTWILIEQEPYFTMYFVL